MCAKPLVTFFPTLLPIVTVLFHFCVWQSRVQRERAWSQRCRWNNGAESVTGPKCNVSIQWCCEIRLAMKRMVGPKYKKDLTRLSDCRLQCIAVALPILPAVLRGYGASCALEEWLLSLFANFERATRIYSKSHQPEPFYGT